MKINSYCVLWLICVLLDHTNSSFQAAKPNNTSYTNEKDLFISNIKNIIEDIVHRPWEDEESPCLQKTLDILRNVQNHTLWATWIWDSMESPTGVLFGSRNQLGNFDECLHPPWVDTHPELKTQYCLANIVLTEKKIIINDDPYTTTDLYIASVSKNKHTVNKLRWGLCLPAVCEQKSIKKFTETFLSNSHLKFALPQASITVDSCQKYNDQAEVSFGFYLTLAYIGSMILLTLSLSYYYEKQRHSKTENWAILLAKSFSIKENTAELFKYKEDEIRPLNSMKCLTSFLAIYLHFILISVDMGFRNSKTFDRYIESKNLIMIFHGDIIIDTFIMISGILLIKSFLASNKPVNIVNTIIRRYFRLTYVMMIIILFITQVSKYYTTGALVPRAASLEVETCIEKWWTNLLMINNYVDFSKSCFPVTWSISCDFHLTILGTCIYWVYQKNRSIGLKVFIVGAVASIVLPTIVAYQRELSPIIFVDLESFDDIRKQANVPTYLHSHLRSGPYFVGMALGFILSVYKPDRKKLSKTVSLIGFTIGFALAWLAFLYGGYLIQRKYSNIEASIYVGTNRSIWAIAIGLILLCCEYGTIPFVSDFLRWPVFGPLSKLNYGIYLTHWPIMISKASTTLSPVIANLLFTIIDVIGVCTFCCGLAFILWLVFEAPMNNIIAVSLRSRSTRNSTYKIQQENGASKNMKKTN